MIERVIQDYYFGPRHPRANTAFSGRWMVADRMTWDRLENDPNYTFEDVRGSGGGFCVVGDDRDDLIAAIYAWVDGLA